MDLILDKRSLHCLTTSLLRFDCFTSFVRDVVSTSLMGLNLAEEEEQNLPRAHVGAHPAHAALNPTHPPVTLHSPSTHLNSRYVQLI